MLAPLFNSALGMGDYPVISDWREDDGADNPWRTRAPSPTPVRPSNNPAPFSSVYVQPKKDESTDARNASDSSIASRLSTFLGGSRWVRVGAAEETEARRSVGARRVRVPEHDLGSGAGRGNSASPWAHLEILAEELEFWAYEQGRRAGLQPAAPGSGDGGAGGGVSGGEEPDSDPDFDRIIAAGIIFNSNVGLFDDEDASDAVSVTESVSPEGSREAEEEGVVSLDVSTVVFLHDALESGGCLDDLRMRRRRGRSEGSEEKIGRQLGSGSGGDANSLRDNNGGTYFLDTGTRLIEGGSTPISDGGTVCGELRTAASGTFSIEGGSRTAKGDGRTAKGDGRDGRPQPRQQRPATQQEVSGASGSSPLSGYEMELTSRLYRLSRGLTALRVSRGSAVSPSVLERPMDVQTFPALQDLRLEGVSLENIQGLFTLRLQLKSLRFERAPLVSLVALLAPHVAADTVPATTAFSVRATSSLSSISRRRAIPASRLQSEVFERTWPSENICGKLSERDGQPIIDGGAMSEGDLDGANSTVNAVSGGSAYRDAADSDARNGGGGSTLGFPTAAAGAMGRGAGEARRVDLETACSEAPSEEKSMRTLQEGQQDGGVSAGLRKRAVSWGSRGGAAGGEATPGEESSLASLQMRLGSGTPALRWSLLEILSVCRCGLGELDASLRLLPRVRKLSLAHNRVSEVNFLQDCPALEELDLSHNRIESLEGVHRVVGNVRLLNLRANRISSTVGLERVFSLEELDLSRNAIRGLEQVARFSSLPLLKGVRLEGNPVEAEERKSYRVSVLSLLYQGRQAEFESARKLASAGGGGMFGVVAAGVALDGLLPSKKELVELSRLHFDSAEKASLAPAFDSALADTAGSDGYPELPMGKQSRFAPTVGATSSAPAARRRTRRRAGKKPLQHFSELVEMETMRDDSADERDDGSGDDSEIKLNVQGPLATQQQTLLTSTNSAMDEDHNDDDEDGDDDDDFGFRRLTSASRKPIKRSGSVTAAAVADAVFASTKSSRRQSRSVAGDLRHTNSGAAADAAAEDAGGAETLENSSRDHSTRAPAAPKNASSSTALRRRSSTGEVVNRGYGRRRGSRAAMIEQPDADAGELSRPGRTRSSESSLSYCTVPLPGMADSTESPAFDDDDGRVTKTKSSRLTPDPEIVPEAEGDVDGDRDAATLSPRSAATAGDARPSAFEAEIPSRATKAQNESSVFVAATRVRRDFCLITSSSSDDGDGDGNADGELVQTLWGQSPANVPTTDMPSRPTSFCLSTASLENNNELRPAAAAAPEPDEPSDMEATGDNGQSSATTAMLREKRVPSHQRGPGLTEHCVEIAIAEARISSAGAVDGGQPHDGSKQSPNVVSEETTAESSLATGAAEKVAADHDGDVSVAGRGSAWLGATRPGLDIAGQNLEKPEASLWAPNTPGNELATQATKGLLMRTPGILADDIQLEGSVGKRPPPRSGTALNRVEPDDAGGRRIDSGRADSRSGSVDATGPEDMPEDRVVGGIGPGGAGSSKIDSVPSEDPRLALSSGKEGEEKESGRSGTGESRAMVGEAEVLWGARGVGGGGGDDDDPEGYRGDEAYEDLLIAEHLELFCRQQVFNGVPYLSYGTNPSCVVHPSMNTTQLHEVMAVFRETSLPCLPPPPPPQPSSSSPSSLSSSLPVAVGSTLSSPPRGDGERNARIAPGALDTPRRSMVDSSPESGVVLREGFWGVRREWWLARALAEAGMAQTAYRRGLSGEARGVFMGEVTCVVVVTVTAVFVLDGVYRSKNALFNEAPKPKVLLAAPLACLERTTIGFRLQKLELHFDLLNVTATGTSRLRERATGGIGVESQRVSVVLLTRDRSRTFNVLQTLEPLATKARRAMGLPATAVENRDGETLEAIAKALPSYAAARQTPFAARFSAMLDPGSAPTPKLSSVSKAMSESKVENSGSSTKVTDGSAPAGLESDATESGGANAGAVPSESKAERCFVNNVGRNAEEQGDRCQSVPTPDSNDTDTSNSSNNGDDRTSTPEMSKNSPTENTGSDETLQLAKSSDSFGAVVRPRREGSSSPIDEATTESIKERYDGTDSNGKKSAEVFQILGKWTRRFRTSTIIAGNAAALVDSGNVDDVISNSGSSNGVQTDTGGEPRGFGEGQLAASNCSTERRTTRELGASERETTAAATPATYPQTGGILLPISANEASVSPKTAADEDSSVQRPPPPLVDPLAQPAVQSDGKQDERRPPAAEVDRGVGSVSLGDSKVNSPQTTMFGKVFLSVFDGGGDKVDVDGGEWGGGDGGDGAVVVFQLLMQRWELRPWVAAPRTLVATKEQMALMDEDHSKLQRTPPIAALGAHSSPPRTSLPSFVETPPPSLAGGARDRGWSYNSTASSIHTATGISFSPSPSVFCSATDKIGGELSRELLTGRDERATAGRENWGRDRAGGKGMAGEEGMADEEMSCVDFADLADVVSVRQEKAAPEQVTIELRGESGRRQWRLQCRTRGSAELVASTLRRLSLERLAQRRRNYWWRRS